MKTHFLTICTLLVFSPLLLNAQSLTDAERQAAVDHLNETKAHIVETVSDLSEGQLNFKASEEAWSVAECIEHLAISETALFGIVEGSLQNEPDPSKRAEVKMNDEQVLGFIVDRSTKVKTSEPFEPSNKFESFEGSLNAFVSKRDSNIAFVEGSQDDLRNRYYDFPFGKLDSYQVILFLSGHSQRHLNQIKEVMDTESFPES